MHFKTIISASTLDRNLANSNWVIFDCRFSLMDCDAGKIQYLQHHIPGAHYVHLNLDLSSPANKFTGRHPLPDFTILTDKLASWGVTNQNQIVVYDSDCGAFAGRMWWLLRCLGHDNIAVLDGGMAKWKQENRQITNEVPAAIRKNFLSSINESQWIDSRFLLDNLENETIKLVDARSPERFSGEKEPIDTIAGHIPHALNRPFQLNLDENGLFLPPDELKKQYKQLLQDTPASHIINMCGSGVTACHNILAMEIAGLNGSRLYPGSWSEWIRDKNRPVEKKY